MRLQMPRQNLGIALRRDQRGEGRGGEGGGRVDDE